MKSGLELGGLVTQWLVKPVKAKWRQDNGLRQQDSRLHLITDCSLWRTKHAHVTHSELFRSLSISK